jgi:hypothetical protein
MVMDKTLTKMFIKNPLNIKGNHLSTVARIPGLSISAAIASPAITEMMKIKMRENPIRWLNTIVPRRGTIV